MPESIAPLDPHAWLRISRACFMHMYEHAVLRCISSAGSLCRSSVHKDMVGPHHVARTTRASSRALLVPRASRCGSTSLPPGAPHAPARTFEPPEWVTRVGKYRTADVGARCRCSQEKMKSQRLVFEHAAHLVASCRLSFAQSLLRLLSTGPAMPGGCRPCVGCVQWSDSFGRAGVDLPAYARELPG